MQCYEICILILLHGVISLPDTMSFDKFCTFFPDFQRKQSLIFHMDYDIGEISSLIWSTNATKFENVLHWKF